MGYDFNSPDINHGVMVVNNRFFTNAARMEGAQLAEPTQLHRVDLKDLETFVKKLDNDGYNLLIFVDSRKKKDERLVNFKSE